MSSVSEVPDKKLQRQALKELKKMEKAEAKAAAAAIKAVKEAEEKAAKETAKAARKAAKAAAKEAEAATKERAPGLPHGPVYTTIGGSRYEGVYCGTHFTFNGNTYKTISAFVTGVKEFHYADGKKRESNGWDEVFVITETGECKSADSFRTSRPGKRVMKPTRIPKMIQMIPIDKHMHTVAMLEDARRVAEEQTAAADAAKEVAMAMTKRMEEMEAELVAMKAKIAAAEAARALLASM